MEKRRKIFHVEGSYTQRHRGQYESGVGGQPGGHVPPKSKWQKHRKKVETHLSRATRLGPQWLASQLTISSLGPCLGESLGELRNHKLEARKLTPVGPPPWKNITTPASSRGVRGWPSPGLSPLSEQRTCTHGPRHTSTQKALHSLSRLPNETRSHCGLGLYFTLCFHSLNSRSSITTCGMNG